MKALDQGVSYQRVISAIGSGGEFSVPFLFVITAL
jgi:hypothetical protein